MRNIKSLLRIIIILTVAGLVFVYAYYKTKDFIRGPVITVAYPINGETVNNSLLKIEGKATSIAYISLDDRQIFTDEAGNFKEKLLLFPGYNIISIKASDKFGRDIEKTLEVVYKEFNKNKPPNSEIKPAVKSANNPTKTDSTSTATSIATSTTLMEVGLPSNPL